ncbi:endoplasmic reticulum transmembrane helix translocase [Brevipalpus obovatus]|uniref:endoplasmic reticulum transmembrane helix translocase n=1 Tax=Brevipalpus obovatus TaxID=246614 RepID=UPI003D9F57D3
MGTQTESHVDYLVSKIVCCKPRPRLMCLYCAPFAGLYASLLIFLNSNFSLEESPGVWLSSIATLIVLHLITYLACHWSVDVRFLVEYKKVNNPLLATHVKVTPTPNNGSPELVPLQFTRTEDTDIIWFIFQKAKYTYNREEGEFEPLKFPVNHPLQLYLEWRGLQEGQQIALAESTFGCNKLDMNVPEFRELFIERATAPFFVFQVFCVCLWCLDELWYYSLMTLGMLIFFECILVFQQIRNLAEIRNMGSSSSPIFVYRSRRWRMLSTDDILPGDLVSIGRQIYNENVPCDLLLIHGSCVVDESLLTGESVPQMKEPLENENDVTRNLDLETDARLHVLFGGTKIVQITPSVKDKDNHLEATPNSCTAFVLRTSFSTTQGKLLRTILFSVKNVTANNLETFFFILFLLFFAILAASYVWIEASKDPERNKYKLFLECILILTTVVPPELPIELSLAVNTSLAALSKLLIFCTEPFRLPLAGKVNMCCFDKTGTLTSEDLLVQGVTGLKNQERPSETVLAIKDAPRETIQVLAACQSLVSLDSRVIGDPLEKSILEAIEWSVTRADAVVPRKGKMPGMRIFHRFHFSSQLKRMSVIAGYSPSGSTNTVYLGLVKGAPEVIRRMLTKVPPEYNNIYTSMSKRGARVLALARRELGNLTHQQIREMTRENLEKNLEFVGFVVFSCPLKPDSASAIRDLISSSHYVRMITGDGPLTACHVARELGFCRKNDTAILTSSEDGSGWYWEGINDNESHSFEPDCRSAVHRNYDLCITGEGLNFLKEEHPDYFKRAIPRIVIFARVAPAQKELIITTLKKLGFSTLMCGDGTNDVGALKHADVGVAITNHAPLTLAELDNKKTSREKPDAERESPRESLPRNRASKRSNHANEPAKEQESKRNDRFNRYLEELQEQDSGFAKLGDASIAAPFTSKLSSINAVCSIIKQGRCTLVTTLQMFKILALNALILAYSHSVLYLDGVKFSDGQATLQGLLLAGCFLFISRSKPLKKLSKVRPLPNIFNAYTILTVLGQFMIHFICLITLVREANELSPKKPKDLKAEFSPSLLNSTVYIISVTLQVATFAVNYKGHPFMESIRDNKPLLYSVIGPFSFVILLITGSIPDVAEQFSIVKFPPEIKQTILLVVIFDITASFFVDRICGYFFGRGSLRKIQ